MIDVRQLTYFIAVVEAKSFTAAAEVLFIAQPALSQHLQRLEEEFGQQLLIRHSRGVEPTQAGLRLVEHARSILTAVESAKSDLRNFDNQPHGHVRVGLPKSLCDTLGVELLTHWSREHPNVDLHIIEQGSHTLGEWILAGRLDLAVTSFPTESRMVVAEPLLQDKMCAVLPGRPSLPELGKIPFTELAQQPLILFGPTNISRQLIDMTAKYCSVKLKIAYEIDSADLALRLVEANQGATIQPYTSMRSYLRMGRSDVRLIVAPSITRRLHLIRSSRRPMTLHETQVYDAIKQLLLKELAAESPRIDLDFAPPEARQPEGQVSAAD
jgi:LysR family transcriptional regulator, nitrogen assimilation regulatory protein